MRAEHGPEEHVEQIPASDWTDMDLLTRELADELLQREIAAETDALQRKRIDPSLTDTDRAASTELRTRRIDAMRRRREQLTNDPAPRMDRRD